MKTAAWYRIQTVVMRNLLRYKYNAMTIIEMVYWPTLDIILWGTTSVWISQNSEKMPNMALAILSGLVFWEMTIRSTYEISLGMLNEVYEKSLLTIFTTPLTITEWILGTLLSGVIRASISMIFCASLVWLLYAKNIFAIGWMFIPFSLSLTLFGWTVGFLVASLIILYGHKVQSLPWMALWLFAPFSAVYYPLDALPTWMKYIAYGLPTSYIFEGMRNLLFTQHTNWHHILISVVLNIIYLTASIYLFYKMFEKSRAQGLARL